MIYYKGFYLWWNNLQNAWMLQSGYNVYHTYKSLSGAKSAITQKWNKG